MSLKPPRTRKRSHRSWHHYDGNGELPCPPDMWVDVTDKVWGVCIDVQASQAFDSGVTHWRPSIDRVVKESRRG